MLNRPARKDSMTDSAMPVMRAARDSVVIR